MTYDANKYHPLYSNLTYNANKYLLFIFIEILRDIQYLSKGLFFKCRFGSLHTGRYTILLLGYISEYELRFVLHPYQLPLQNKDKERTHDDKK
jgi:hypothetical protein